MHPLAPGSVLHTRERRIRMGALDQRAIARMEPGLVVLVERLLDHLADRPGPDLAPHEQRSLTRTHPLRVITTRRHHAGTHGLDLRINGRVVAGSSFELRAAAPAEGG